MQQVREGLAASGTGADKLAPIDQSLASLASLGRGPVEPVTVEEWREAAAGAEAAVDLVVREQHVTRAKAQKFASTIVARSRAVAEAENSGGVGTITGNAAAAAVGLKPAAKAHPKGVVARNGPDPELVGSGALWRWQGTWDGTALVSDPVKGKDTLSLRAGDVEQQGDVIVPLAGSGAQVLVERPGAAPVLLEDAGGGVWGFCADAKGGGGDGDPGKRKSPNAGGAKAGGAAGAGGAGAGDAAGGAAGG